MISPKNSFQIFLANMFNLMMTSKSSSGLQLNTRIDQFTMENGTLKMIKGMEEEFNAGSTDPDMKDIGRMIKQILKECFIMQTEMFMKENG